MQKEKVDPVKFLDHIIKDPAEDRPNTFGSRT